MKKEGWRVRRNERNYKYDMEKVKRHFLTCFSTDLIRRKWNFPPPSLLAFFSLFHLSDLLFTALLLPYNPLSPIHQQLPLPTPTKQITQSITPTVIFNFNPPTHPMLPPFLQSIHKLNKKKNLTLTSLTKI